MRYLKQNSIYVDFFQDSEFADFRQSLDAEMKRLQGSGLGSQKKQAEPLTAENEYGKLESLELTIPKLY